MINQNLYYYKAKVNKIIDGDTINLTIDLGFKIYHTSNCRLAKINTPELRATDMIVKEAAYKAKEFVESLLPIGSEVLIESTKLDKYGRPVVDVYYGDKNNSLNNDLLENGFAIPFMD